MQGTGNRHSDTGADFLGPGVLAYCQDLASFSFLNLGAEGRELNGGGASDEDVPLGVCVCVS